MAVEWIQLLGRINRKAGIQPGDPVPVDNVLQAMNQAGVPETEQARILAGFMAVVKPVAAKSAAEPAAAPASASPVAKQTMSLDQIVTMFKDPSKHADLVKRFNALSAEEKQEIAQQLAALKTQSAAAADQNQAIQKPLTAALAQIEQIVKSSLPKRTKMLDVIDALNAVLPSPALNLQAKDGKSYAEKFKDLLRSSANQFGTTATPGDRFVNSIVASIDKNQPIELPTSALESIKRKGNIVK